MNSYNAIKAYKKEGKLESLTATEHLVSAAEAGELNAKKMNVFFWPVHMLLFLFVCQCWFYSRWQV